MFWFLLAGCGGPPLEQVEPQAIEEPVEEPQVRFDDRGYLAGSRQVLRQNW
ncbi:MAG: hypothetical protein HN348_26645 [Proteobacteria bacterium]|nr:hypothetical protein [Pseudomonadota bacterium]